MIPLAYLLDDDALRHKVDRYVGYILDHQGEDGWFGPRAMVAAANRPENPHYDLWAQLLITKVLYEYRRATGDPRIVEAQLKHLRLLDRIIDRGPLFNWAQFRWFEALIAVYDLYETTGQSWLLALAVKLHAQGFDWAAFFKRWPLTGPTPRGRWNYMGHVVNNAMAVKGPALWYRLSGDPDDREAPQAMLDRLDRYHGSVTGVFTGDECLAGPRPTQGTELCAVVELAYSLEILLSTLGDPRFGDRLEEVVYNALPATFAPDMWSHQYDQQVNQIECSARDDWPWTTNGPESNLFGLEPNYGCCTANLSQGWPKFAAHLWMETGRGDDGGLAALAYAPCRVQAEIQGVPVTVEVETGYPFRDTVRLTVTADKPVAFPIHLRIPEWGTPATVQVAGEEPDQAQHSGHFYGLYRKWQETTQVTLTFPMSPALRRGYNGAVALQRGPLIYALPIGEDWRRAHPDRPVPEPWPSDDWEIHPTTPWNYALDLDPQALSETVQVAERPLGELPFSPDGAPISLSVQGRRLPEWGRDGGCAADAPQSPVRSAEPLESLTLIPYGCTNLRITEFPVLEST